jgi:glycosyltransferase involved in cell wall biosynthesis
LNDPKVSVVIPTYNRPDFLRTAVESVLDQTFENFECLVVDDGSEEWEPMPEDPRLSVIHHDENRGVSAARNTGIRASSAPFIAFLDDDDRWRPEKLERQLEFFEEHPSAHAVQPEAIWYRDGERIEQKDKHRKPDGDIFPRALERCLVSGSGVMIRREVFDEVGTFDEELPACEDYDLWLRMGLQYPVYLIEEPLVEKYGGRPDQLSSQPGLDKYRVYALRKFVELPGSEPYRERAYELIVEKCEIYSQGCRKRDKTESAEEFERYAHEARERLNDSH